MDPRAVQARELHRRIKDGEALVARDRDQRNAIIRGLRAEDPKRWTYPAIAKAVGITPELAAAIVQGRTR